MQAKAMTKMRDAMRRTLIEWDAISKKIAAVQKSRDTQPAENRKQRVTLEIHYLHKQYKKIVKEAEDANEAYTIMTSQGQKDMKKLEKAFNRLEHAIAQKEAMEKNLLDLEEELGRAEEEISGTMAQGTDDIESLKEDFKTLVSVLQSYHAQHPEVYAEVERETGIFFFTVPTK